MMKLNTTTSQFETISGIGQINNQDNILASDFKLSAISDIVVTSNQKVYVTDSSYAFLVRYYPVFG